MIISIVMILVDNQIFLPTQNFSRLVSVTNWIRWTVEMTVSCWRKVGNTTHAHNQVIQLLRMIEGKLKIMFTVEFIDLRRSQEQFSSHFHLSYQRYNILNIKKSLYCH